MDVRFISVKLKSTFDALENKESNVLYYIESTQEFYKGSQLFGTGSLATEQAAGLLSAEDYAALKVLIANGTAGSNTLTLTPVDGTISITDTDTGKAIGVTIASDATNALTAVDGGLFVPTVVVPEYSIEKQETAEDGFTTSYKLKKMVGDEVFYVGDAINIAKDLVLQSATLETVTEDGIPYADAKVGDPYISMVFNNEEASSLYVPVKDLVDKFEAGTGISIEDNVVSVKLADTTHGLVAVDGALTLNLATKDSDGAMSKEDKLAVDSLPYAYVTRKYEITDAPIGTLVNYGEKEIRVMCPSDATFVKQTVGAGGDSNTYYMTFKTYAPSNDVVGYMEHINDQYDTEILTDLQVDAYGRKYQPTWLSLATYDEATDTWTYRGAESTASNLVGWNYQIDWYGEDNVRIATDSIRINLSNEDWHNYIKPCYSSDDDIATDVAELQETVATLEQAYSWSEM